ncbi:hypothetical protein H2203_006969 [Taxawa tesnikishii (nom. ined.)]|nr:hypothetical protein H2203_006969 [Dothideales sp. JES 119]
MEQPRDLENIEEHPKRCLPLDQGEHEYLTTLGYTVNEQGEVHEVANTELSYSGRAQTLPIDVDDTNMPAPESSPLSSLPEGVRREIEEEEVEERRRRTMASVPLDQDLDALADLHNDPGRWNTRDLGNNLRKNANDDEMPEDPVLSDPEEEEERHKEDTEETAPKKRSGCSCQISRGYKALWREIDQLPSKMLDPDIANLMKKVLRAIDEDDEVFCRVHLFRLCQKAGYHIRALSREQLIMRMREFSSGKASKLRTDPKTMNQFYKSRRPARTSDARGLYRY